MFFLLLLLLFLLLRLFFTVLLLLLFFDYIFCMLFESFLVSVVVVVVVVAFKCLCFFLTASFDLSLIPLCLFPLHTQTAVETDRTQSKNGGTSLIFSLLFDFSLSDVSAQSMRSRAPFVVEGFLLMQVRTLLQMSFDGGSPSAFMPQ